MVEHNKIYDLAVGVIKRYACEEKPIDQNTILRKILADPRNQCERKTLSRALEKIRADYGLDDEGNWPDPDNKLHYEVVKRSSSDIYRQYYFEEHGGDVFSDEELMFLMDAVQFSKNIDQKFTADIIKKLAGLSSNKYSRKFELYKNLNEKQHPVRKDFLLVFEDINRAINGEKMISFYENQYGTDMQLQRIGKKPVEVNPFKIVVVDDNCYLLCTKRDSKVMTSYRVDRITDVKILDEDCQYSDAKRKAITKTNEYIIEHRYMYSGDPVDVTLVIDRNILGDVIDSFGKKITIDPAEENENRLTVHVKSSEKDMIDWAMRYGEYAKISEPEYLKNEIRNRLRFLMTSYREDDTRIEYLEHIENAKESGRLFLRNIDLNRQDSYKELTNIESAFFYHNGITDFSFLPVYSGLKRLRIVHNEIRDPGVISKLKNLDSLRLGRTGVKDLDFLCGLKELTRLSLYEFSLENVEAVYSLPKLTNLSVNKPVSRLIDEKRLRKVFGQSLMYSVENSNRALPMSRGSLPLDKNIVRGYETESMESFSSFEITDTSVKASLCTMIYPGSRHSNRNENKVFTFIEGACENEERLNMFNNISHYSGADYSWYVTCDCSSSEFDPEKVLTISIFKKDHGLKLIGFAVRNLTRENYEDESSRELSNKFYSAEDAHIRYLLDNKIGWAEPDDMLEGRFRINSTMEDLIDPEILKKHKVFGDIEIDTDHYHYYRKNDSGKRNVKKIAYGHIELE